MATSEKKLKKLLTEIAKVRNYAGDRIEIKPISSEGANFSSILFLGTITDPPKPDINIFAKVANLKEEVRKQNVMIKNMFKIETTFYTDLAVNFERLYLKNHVPTEHRLPIPKYYGHVMIEFEEMLVLENLEASGYRSFDRMKTYDWEYAATASQQLARFHALSLALRDDDPTEFDKIAKILDIDILKDSSMMEEIIAQSIKNGCEAVNEENKERLQKYFSSLEDTMNIMKYYTKDKTLIIHGDFRPSNLMDRRHNGKLEVIPVDYQTLRLGNPVGDLMLLIVSGSDEEFRQLHYQRLLDHYYAELTLALRNLHIDIERVYTKKKYEQDLKESLPLGLILGLMYTPMVTANPEDAPKWDLDLTSDFNIKPNQLARERLDGIVRDFVRWGLL